METISGPQRKRRAACDQCHASKVKCPGGPAPCSRCRSGSLLCHYSFAARIGKPPGSKNKKTLERLRANEIAHPNARSSVERVGSTEEFGNQQLDRLATLTQTHATDTLEPVRQAQIPRLPRSGLPGIEARGSIQDQALMTEIDLGASSLNDVSLHSLDNILSSHDVSFSQQQIEWNMHSVLTPHTCNGSTDTALGAYDDDMAVWPPLSDATGAESGAPTQATAQSTLADRNENICACFEEQTRNLAELRYLERQSNLTVDVLLNSARQVAEAAEKLLQCRKCGNDIQMLMSSVMTFQIVFRWAKSLAHAPHVPCPDPGIQMGQYKMSHQESVMLKDVLVASTYGKLRTALVGLKAKVEFAKAEMTDKQLWDFEKGELQSLEHSVVTLLQTASALATRMKAV